MNKRRVLLVGASGGVGEKTAYLLAEQGYELVLIDRNVELLKAINDRLGHSVALYKQVDIADYAQVRNFFSLLQNQDLAVSCLVNTAAISPFAEDGSRLLLPDTTPDIWEHVFSVNTFGTYALCREFMLHINWQSQEKHEKINNGRIVNLSSAAAELGGYKSCTAYVASKSAVIGFTKALARELAPLKITANVVAPGLIETPMLRSGLKTENDVQAVELVPLARIGAPEEVACAIAYLLSEGAAYVTGSTLDVNGGYYMV